MVELAFTYLTPDGLLDARLEPDGRVVALPHVEPPPAPQTGSQLVDRLLSGELLRTRVTGLS